MTSEEWIAIGLKNGIIDNIGVIQQVSFLDAYLMWFRMKMTMIKPQSLDRIEVTFNRYYKDNDISSSNVSAIDTTYINDFIRHILFTSGTITPKEFSRIWQIITNVMVYCLDLNIGGAKIINWGLIKRLLQQNMIKQEKAKEYCISKETIKKLTYCVVEKQGYSLKQSACLCLLLNFYLGLRIGELAALKWSDIDYERKVIRVLNTEVKYFERDAKGERTGNMKYDIVDDLKTIHSFREIPLISQAYEFLLLLREWHVKKGYQSDYLAYDGVDAILVCSLDKTLRKLCKLCNIEHFNSHLVRKSFATYLHNNSVPTRVISDLLGHAEITTTEQVYIVSTIPDLEPLRLQMEQSFQRKEL